MTYTQEVHASFLGGLLANPPLQQTNAPTIINAF